MAIIDNKINSFSKPVSSLPDEPLMDSEQLKATFDSNSNELKMALNALITDLLAQTAASELGATPFKSVSSTTIQGQIEKLEQDIVNLVSGIIPIESIDSEKLQTASVTNEKLADESVTIDKLNDDVLATSDQAKAGTEDKALLSPFTANAFYQSKKATVSQAITLSNDANHLTPYSAKKFLDYCIVRGNYTGSNQSSKTITLGFKPRILFITNTDGEVFRANYFYGCMITDLSNNSQHATLTTTGFVTTTSGSSRLNYYALNYHYVAIR